MTFRALPHEITKEVVEAALGASYGWVAHSVLEDLWLPDEDDSFLVVGPLDMQLAIADGLAEGDEGAGTGASVLGRSEELDRMTLVETDSEKNLILQRLAERQASKVIGVIGVPPPTQDRQTVMDLVEHVTGTLLSSGDAFLLLPMWLLVADEASSSRTTLLESGRVLDLILFPLEFLRAHGPRQETVCFLHLQGFGGPEIEGTAVYKFDGENEDQFNMFLGDIVFGAVWNWGFRTVLPQKGAWSYPSLLRTAGSRSSSGTIRNQFVGSSNADWGEAYALIWDIETTFSRIVIRQLQDVFTSEGESWWLKGVPEDVRIKAAHRYEEDQGRSEKATFLDLSDLPRVVAKNWEIFQSIFDPDNRGKGKSLHEYGQIIDIRKRVMHPMRGQATSLVADELESLTSVRAELQRIEQRWEQL